jgi:hypothetical protein
VVPGGADLDFTVVIDNPGPQDFMVRPNFVAGGEGPLSVTQSKLQVQDDRGGWHPAAVDPASGHYLLVALPDGGDVQNDTWLYVPAGGEAKLRGRLSVAADVSTGPGYLFGFVPGVVVDPDGNPVSQVHGGNGINVRIGADESPSSSASASTSAFPSGTPSASATASAAATTASATPTTVASSGASSASGAPVSGQGAVPAALTGGSSTSAPVTVPAASVISAAKAAGLTRSSEAGGGSSTGKSSLAYTGGGGDATPIALGGAAAVALGAGVLVVLRRRGKAGSHA